MPRPEARRHRVDGLSVRHVADLVLAADLVRERAEPLFPSGDENAEPTSSS